MYACIIYNPMLVNILSYASQYTAKNSLLCTYENISWTLQWTSLTGRHFKSLHANQNLEKNNKINQIIVFGIPYVSNNRYQVN